MDDIYEDFPKAGTVAKDKPACSGETTVFRVSNPCLLALLRFPTLTVTVERSCPDAANNAATNTAPAWAASHHNEDSGTFTPPCGCDGCYWFAAVAVARPWAAAGRAQAGCAVGLQHSRRR